MTRSPDIRVELGTPPSLVELIWQEFFASRGRGKSVAQHAPCLTDKEAVRSIFAESEDDILGGLIVKDRCLAEEAAISMIGFVCVRPEKRGQHISRLLLQRAIEDARGRGIDGLVLWTTSPQVYAHVGFEPDPRDIFFQTRQLEAQSPLAFSVESLDLAPRGLPAFADGAVKLQSEQASATILETPNGPILAEWTGADGSVIDLLGAGVKGSLWVNAQASDSLPSAIKQRNGSPLKTLPSRRLALALDRVSMMEFPEIRILDRI